MRIAPRIVLAGLALIAVTPAAWALEPDNVYRAWDNYRQHYDSSGHIISPGVTGSTGLRSNGEQWAAPQARRQSLARACLQGPPACTAAGYPNLNYSREIGAAR